MKTISVKQVAEALSLTPRAVIYRLEKGQLKGTQQPNAFGKQEWRVYPTKEIIEGLKKQQPSETKDDTSLNFSPDYIEVVDAIAGEQGDRDEQQPEEDSHGGWREVAKDTLRGLAEELVRPLAETIREQQELLAQKDKVIAEKDQQLRLLPDFQKQAENERKAAELNALEAQALKKQIAALEEQRIELEARAGDLQALKAKVDELQRPWWRRLLASEKG